MSTLLTRKGADYSLNSRRFSAPVSAGLIGWWYLGGLPGDDAPTAQARTVKNLAPTAHAMTVVGAPTIATTGYVQVDGSNYLNTTIPETMDFSLVALAYPTVANAAWMSWTGTGTDKNLFSNGGTQTTIATFTVRDTGGGVHGQVASGSLAIGVTWTAMRVVSFKINGTSGVTSVRDLTGGGAPGTATITSRVLCAGSPSLRVGGQTSQFPGACRVGFVAIYNRSITDAEGDSIRQFVAKYRLAKYGDVV